MNHATTSARPERPSAHNRADRGLAASVTAVLAAALCAGPASAIDLSDTHTFDLSMSSGQATVTVPQFDDHEGARSLQSVSFHVQAEVGGNASVENPDHFAYDDVALELNATVTASVGDLLTILRYSTSFLADRPIAESDGAPGGPDSHDFGYLGLLDSGNDTTTTNLGAFIGKGSVNVSLVGVAAFIPFAEYEHWDWTFSDVLATGQVTITYEYADTTPTTCEADLDGDGNIGFSDLLQVLSAWGACPVVTLCPQDVQPDGNVGASDLFFILTHWGPCS